MIEITDVNIEDWIYMLNGGDRLQWIVILAGVALLMAVTALIKLFVLFIKSKVDKGIKLKKGDGIIALVAVCMCVVSIPIIIIAMWNTRMSYFLSRFGIVLFFGGIALVYIVITLVRVKSYSDTMITDLAGGVFTLGAAMFLAIWSLVSNSYEEQDWYVAIEEIEDLSQNTNRTDYVYLKGSGEIVPVMSECLQELWADICDEKTVEVYVVYGEDGEALVAFDMKEKEYAGKRLVEE
ncbi:MAG: hypothetical protein IJ409_09335 [Lachnospiraceae bacterium]|nr:hypothetical protein [Lachnospiraceae bacterium]